MGACICCVFFNARVCELVCFVIRGCVYCGYLICDFAFVWVLMCFCACVLVFNICFCIVLDFVM